MQKLAKKWGPHAKGTRVTTDPAEADEAHGSRRWPVLLVGATRLAWLEAEGYFRGGQSAEDPDGDAEPAAEPAALVAEADAAPAEAEDAAPPAEPPFTAEDPNLLSNLTGDVAVIEPQEGDDDGR